jgi:hypothetical protein
MTGSKQLDHWTSGTVNECNEIAGSRGLPPQQQTMWLWSQKEDLQRAWNQDRRAVWYQVGLSHCRQDGLVTVRDEAHLRQGHNDKSRQSHQCSKTTLTGESQFQISTPLGIEPGSLMMGSKRKDHYIFLCRLECAYTIISSVSVSEYVQYFPIQSLEGKNLHIHTMVL